MTPPPALHVPWHGRLVRVRHDDPLLRPYGPRASVLAAAMQLARGEDGLARAIEVAMGDRYRVDVAPGPEVRLRVRKDGV